MLIIPANINKANEYLLRLARIFQQKMRTKPTNYNNNNRGNTFRQSLQVNPPPRNYQPNSSQTRYPRPTQKRFPGSR